MASNYRIVRHGCDEWGVISKSGLFYPDEITVEIRDNGLILGEWTLNQIVEGFKKSLNHLPIDTHRCDSHHEVHARLNSDWKAVREVDNKVNGQVVHIASLENEIKDLKQDIKELQKIINKNWNYNQIKFSGQHGELVNINHRISSLTDKYEKHVHNTKPETIYKHYTDRPEICTNRLIRDINHLE